MRPKLSLSRQLALAILLAFSVLLGGGGFLIYWSVKSSLYEQFDASLLIKARIVMTNSQQQNRDIRVYFSDQYLREFDDAIASEFFQVIDMQGVSVERSDSLEADDLPVRYGSVEDPAFWDTELPNGRPGRSVGIRFVPRVASILPDQEPAEAVVVVASDTTRLLETLANLRLTLWMTGGAVLGLSLLSVPLMLHSILRPLRQVAGETSKIDTSSHGYRFRTGGMPAELKPVTERLNEFLDRLEASYQRERQFSSDIAHELRTPLTELRSLAEIALKWPEEVTQEHSQSVLEAALQMESLVNRLLELARSEQQQFVILTESVHVDTLASQIFEALKSRLEARKLEIAQLPVTTLSKLPVTTDAGRFSKLPVTTKLPVTNADSELPVTRAEAELPVTVGTDPVLLRSILQNLLENAVEYADAGSKVLWGTGIAGGRITFVVANRCTGIGEAEIKRMFDRLWRRDPSRTGTHGGLGLTLARSYAQRLGMRLEARLRESDWIEFRLEGPVRAQES